MKSNLYLVTGYACGESWAAGWWTERQPAEDFAVTARRAAEAFREAKRRSEAGFVRPAAVREEKARAELRRLDPEAVPHVDDGETVVYDVAEVRAGPNVPPVLPEPAAEPSDPEREAFLDAARAATEDPYFGPQPGAVASLAALWGAREARLRAWSWPSPERTALKLPPPGALVLAWTSDGGANEEPGWEPARFRHQESDGWQAMDDCRSKIEPAFWVPLPPAPLQRDGWSHPGPSPVPDFKAVREAIRASGVPVDEAPARAALARDLGGTAADDILERVREAFDPAFDPAGEEDEDVTECLRRLARKRHARVLKMLGRRR